ncbi:MFS transporter [Pseudoteredinibacter isoporae]|uniref:Putative MFS family arabinose efflux permease n=1 Tax=Pseudoteredinibacter isoporae TaxID=570281 RepID=A0A7X0JT70_9GAMM|nr:MFS transporter [Pseudoteredinibacter isoporae]MBB6521258.1 putative MFS family arabinose efflux permease [Pseudoteredinibacter isoporae]NHO86816.1 MFS transporter [Pseudoteredinibacter isoporae]NIB24732.1 MFS transporter [Pseudoteredinibacter isoporae]
MSLLLDHSGRRVSLAALGALPGLMPLAILPAYLGALVSHGGYSASDAGVICALNLLGNALGVMWVSWRPSGRIVPILLMGFCLEVIADILASVLEPGNGLPFLRLIAGVGGGLFTGVGFRMIAASNKTDAGFGLLILLQFLLGALLLDQLPPLVEAYGVRIIYLIFIACALLSTLAFFFLSLISKSTNVEGSDLLFSRENTQTGHPPRKTLNKLQASLALLAIIAFEISASGVWAYAEQIASAWSISVEDTAGALAWGALAGIPGSFLVVLQGDRWGRLLPVVLAVLIAALSLFWLSGLSGSDSVFLIAMLVFNFSWAYVVPYMQAEQATLDETGQLATFGMSAVLLAIAYGPYLFSLFIASDGHQTALTVCLALLMACVLFTILLAYFKRASGAQRS